ncbi:MAG TPA: hypothetical protein VHF69_01305, partial [Candidatus Synoicihabitans sp.]|nr:hypothetical protein [Candidatus Synoicihabitans sp.]
MKISNQPAVVTSTAIAQALATSDDFGHEMRVKAVLERGAYVEHGWAYIDPVEGKPRQFDLRARLDHSDRPRRIHMAVECKNLAAEAPLVISGTLRTKAEAFHHYVLAEADRRGRGVMDVWRDQHIYPLGQFVGKSIVRLRTEKGRLVAGPDNDIYKGW